MPQPATWPHQLVAGALQGDDGAPDLRDLLSVTSQEGNLAKIRGSFWLIQCSDAFDPEKRFLEGGLAPGSHVTVLRGT